MDTIPGFRGRPMNCQTAREQIGPYLDGELAPADARALEAHLAECPACQSEHDAESALIQRMTDSPGEPDVHAPAELWPAIEQRLGQPASVRPPSIVLTHFRRPVAIAASLALIIGAGIFLAVSLGPGGGPVQAMAIDYSLLMDGITKDVEAAIERFITHYHGEPIDADDAPSRVPSLGFRIPPELPGGYRRERVYRLRFGDVPGVAARYVRDGEPMIIFFHPPAPNTQLGVHRESPCHVGQHRGHQIEAGPWRLVHYTDPTTCHCVLSTLDPEAGLPAVFAEIAPGFAGPEPARP
jgi:hypothetical protein